MPKEPVYLGEVTGDNMQVSPDQLLDMVKRDLVDRPATGILIQVIRQEPGKSQVSIDHYRARVPFHTEVTVTARMLHNLMERG